MSDSQPSVSDVRGATEKSVCRLCLNQVPISTNCLSSWRQLAVRNWPELEGFVLSPMNRPLILETPSSITPWPNRDHLRGVVGPKWGVLCPSADIVPIIRREGGGPDKASMLVEPTSWERMKN